MTPAVFLDRDGVINADSPDYIKSLDEFHWIPGSLDAIVRISRVGWNVIIVTNQSGLHRRLFSRQTLDEIHEHLIRNVVSAGGRITDIHYCPHRPEEACPCRKPNPKMVLDACRRHGIAPSKACMIGDSVKDIQCAVNAGVGFPILVRTGNGKAAETVLLREGPVPHCIHDDLAAAVSGIMEKDYLFC